MHVSVAPRCWHAFLLDGLMADAKCIYWPRCSLGQSEGQGVHEHGYRCMYTEIYIHIYTCLSVSNIKNAVHLVVLDYTLN